MRTPSILTILGVIMCLRLGWVVGSVGLPATVLIITASTFITALSVATIHTDRRVRIGGAYLQFQSATEVESGGAIGLPRYLALALRSVTLVIRIQYPIMRVIAVSVVPRSRPF
ncbi:MAG: hypothetical protein OYK82_09480 [Gammaproteobacteria bacterium]|nr:hypothetical protein [Gammaproteobacteria bacterium]